MTVRGNRRAGVILAALLAVVVVGAGILPALHDHTAGGPDGPDQCALCRVSHETHFLPAHSGSTTLIGLPVAERTIPLMPSQFLQHSPDEPTVRGPPTSL